MTTINEEKLGALMGQMIGHLTGGAVAFAVLLGDELGLYRALNGAGPVTSDTLAGKTGCNGRLVREWLDGQTAAGLIDYDTAADTYSLSPESAMALADDSSPVFLARGVNAFRSLFVDLDKIKGAFTGNGGLPWGDHHQCLFKGTEWFFRTGYRAYLTTAWIPALEGVEAKLNAGASVADIGCGHGASSIVMAGAYPKSRFHGFDYHEPSIVASKERAVEARVSDRTTFAVADAKSYPGKYDLICFFDCLHDMGDPVGIARYAREHLNPGGSILLVEPFALDDRIANLSGNPMATLLYTASSAICTPNSLSQEVGLGLGAQAGEAKLRTVFEEAGFKSFRRATETPMNLILQAKA